MMLGLDGLLGILPDVILGEQARLRLRRAGRDIPDGLSSTVVLEVRLDDDPRVDLGLLVRTERELAVLAGVDPAIGLAPDGAGPARWRTARDVAARAPVMSEAGQLSRWLWLELDLHDDDPTREPGVFAVTSPDGAMPAAAGWDPMPAVAAVVAAAKATPPIDAVTSAVDHLVRRGFVICQVGLFPARLPPAVRLFCLAPAGASAEELVDALAAGGRCGPGRELGRWARICTGWREKIYLHLDITTDGIQPQVGIDVPFAGTPLAWARPRWGSMLPDLFDAGLCAPAKRRAIEDLPGGYDIEAFGRRHYHVDLLSTKVTVGADGRARAKAYIMASH